MKGTTVACRFCDSSKSQTNITVSPILRNKWEDSHFDGIGYHVLALRRHLFPNVLDVPLEKKAPYEDIDD